MIKPNIFISYKRNHAPTAELVDHIESMLSGAGYNVWRDVNIEPGAQWSTELYTWLMECSAAVALIGKNASESEWCRREWWFLRERYRVTGLPVIPIAVGGSHNSGAILDDFQALKVSDEISDEVITKLLAGVREAKPSARDYLAAHQAWLGWQFNDAPVWGREPFALKDVYVETECGRLAWSTMAQTSGATQTRPLDPFVDSDETGGRHNLIETTIELISDPNFRELIIVQGTPGCGKSAFTLRLANALVARGLRPSSFGFATFGCLPLIGSTNY